MKAQRVWDTFEESFKFPPLAGPAHQELHIIGCRADSASSCFGPSLPGAADCLMQEGGKLEVGGCKTHCVVNAREFDTSHPVGWNVAPAAEPQAVD